MTPLRAPTLPASEVMKLMKRAPRIRVGALSDRTYKGKVYMSKAEAKYAAELDLKKKAGLIRDWRSQVPFQITVSGHKICKVIVDFAVDEKDGTTRYVEIKGSVTEVYQLKKRLLNACYPDITYEVLRAWR